MVNGIPSAAGTDMTKQGGAVVKYAVISDIHGNAPALRLAMADARAHGAEAFLFAGDYCVSAPWAEDAVNIMRATPNALYVRGNEEKYLHLPEGDDAQFEISRWTARNMSQENIAWLDVLPERLEFAQGGVNFHMAHSSEEFIGAAEMDGFMTRQLVHRYPENVSQEFRLQDVQNTLAKNEALQAQLKDMPGGVYIFGHTHSQWHARFGDVLLVNPGSVGLPVDCTHFGAPYTLLTVKNGCCTVEERRVIYDAEMLIAQVKQTDQYRAARVWSEMIFSEWRTCREMAMYMLRYIEAYARRTGDDRRPYMPDTWEAGFAAWQAEENPWVMVEDGDFPR